MIATILKETFDLHCKTQTYIMTYSKKMDALVKFRLLVIESRKYGSKAESPINMSAEAVISGKLAIS